jgi:hypothetical protein
MFRTAGFAFLVVVNLFAAVSATAQGALVSPRAIITSSGASAIVVANPSGEAMEVTLGTLYGFPIADSAGNMTLATYLSVPDTAPSASEWVELYPRRFLLAPHGKQTVRLLASPPDGLADGEYWARVVVSTRTPRSKPASDGTLQVALDLEVRTIVPFLFRHGHVGTGIALGPDLGATASMDSLTLRPDLSRIGNAAWLGTLGVTVLDSDGNVVAATAHPLAVYYSLRPRLTIPLTRKGNGPLTLRVTARAERADILSSLVLPARTISVENAVRR